MPLKSFLCPDGVTRPILECLEKCPLETGRCLSLPTLTEIGYDRKWTGTPSTTQLLNPTRIEYLKIKHDYAISPFDRAFALLGTRHHRRLELVAKRIEGLEAEKKLTGEVTGIVDLLEPNGESDTWRLIDYKTWGSYQVAKFTGEKDGVYEIHQVELQLNNYRIMAQDLGFNITQLFIQATVRDGGTYTARNNKVPDKMLLIPVKILDDNYVREYFLTKAFALKSAVDKGILPDMCDYNGRWAGRRCKPEYCEVYRYCPEGAMMNKVKCDGN